MRFEQLTLRIPGDEFVLRFHDRLTVMNGLGVMERRAMIDSVLGALVGSPESTSLSYVDGAGDRVTVDCEDGEIQARLDDGTPVPDILRALDLDPAGLRALVLVGGAELGLGNERPGVASPELAEARATLAAVTEEYQGALAARQTVDAMRDELAAIDERLRQAGESQARRQYAKLLADLERVRAEAAALRTGRNGADSDRHLLKSADGARDLAGVWQEASAAVVELSAAFGDADRLDDRTLEQAVTIPDEPPAGLDDLVAALGDIQDSRDELSRRLSRLAASRLPDPSHPAVADLARLDQDALWALNGEVLDAADRVRDESMAMGGMPAEGSDDTPVVEEIERHHQDVVAAEELVQKSRLKGLAGSGAGVLAGAAGVVAAPVVAPIALAGAAGVAGWALLRPRRKLAKASEAERYALERAGASTYLAFHLRRVDAMTDPGARERLELAALEHRLAEGRWHELVGDVEPELAATLEAETREYAESLASLGGAADEIESVRVELADRVEPAYQAALSRLLAKVEPYGIDDVDLAPALVPHQVELGRRARLQRRLESAEATEEQAREKLDGALGELGFDEGDLSARVGAFEWAYSRAEERERSRATARSLADVESDLTRLEAEARRLRRPEWASVTASEADALDVPELTARRESLLASYETTRALVPDVDRLADRHSALERRVAVLELGAGAGQEDDSVDAADVRQYLLALLTKAASSGPDGEPLPVLLDEAFLRLQADSKWEILDLLERLSEKTQLIYLTDDPYVGAWARRRSAAGAITLMEPVAEEV